MGVNAGNLLITGEQNVGIGTNALNSNFGGSWNTAIGEEALNNNYNGHFNTAEGYFALYSNYSGEWNVAIGTGALTYNYNGQNNTAIGNNALLFNQNGSYNTDGNSNTAIGALALASNIDGDQNVAIGYEALGGNWYGSNNIAIGSQADVNSDNLSNVIVIGAGTLASGSNQIILGNSAMQSLNCMGAYNSISSDPANLCVNSSGEIKRTNNSYGVGSGSPGQVAYWTTSSQLGGDENFTWDNNRILRITDNYPGVSDGMIYKNNEVFLHNSHEDYRRIEYNNTFLGINSGKGMINNNSSTNGGCLTGIGYKSLYSNYNGEENTGIGSYAIYSNTTGSQNTAIGAWSLYANLGGHGNTAVGEDALTANSSGQYNVAVGKECLVLNNGSNNTGIGGYALSNNITGIQNTAIGYSADVSANNLTNATVIGYGAIASASNQIVLGNTSVTSLYSMGATASTSNGANMYVDPTTGQIMRSTSSIRYKENVTDLTINTSGIYDLKPVSYTNKIDHRQYFGLIAEDVVKLFPQLVEYTKAKYVIPGSTSDELIPDAVRYPMLSVLILRWVLKIHFFYFDSKKS